MVFNKEINFDRTWLENVSVNLRQLEAIAQELTTRHRVSGFNEVVWAVKALTVTDLTTLSGDDTKANVTRLCQRAAYPFPLHVTEQLVDQKLRNQIHTAAICVYPARVADARATLKSIGKESDISIAAVAAGFPTGQYPLATRLQEIKCALLNGASEIDIVIDRSLALQGRWEELYKEIVQMRTICGVKAYMKTILAVGELGTMQNVYKASMVAMMAGSDFIKTSTGKESVNATLPVGLVMIRAIQDFQKRTNRKIGFKPAGGVRTVQDAILWMTLIKETLGTEWLRPELFRFGASGLLDDIETVVLRNIN